MPDGGVGADRAFLHQEVKVGGGADSLGCSRLDERSADTEVAHACDIVAAIASPVDPHMLGSRDTARESFRRCRCRQWMELEKAFHAGPRIAENKLVDRTGMPESYSRGRPKTSDFALKINEMRSQSYLV
jgi:hypothetical protein